VDGKKKEAFVVRVKGRTGGKKCSKEGASNWRREVPVSKEGKVNAYF